MWWRPWEKHRIDQDDWAWLMHFCGVCVTRYMYLPINERLFGLFITVKLQGYVIHTTSGHHYVVASLGGVVCGPTRMSMANTALLRKRSTLYILLIHWNFIKFMHYFWLQGSVIHTTSAASQYGGVLFGYALIKMTEHGWCIFVVLV